MRSIVVTYEYRCPFARNAHEAIVTAIRDGLTPDIEWRFAPYLLDQNHVEPGEPDMWDRPETMRGGGLLALEWSVAARDMLPLDAFLALHTELFRQRHDRHQSLGAEVLRAAATAAGLDADALAAEVASGRPRDLVAREHRDLVKEHDVFGVPTFIEDGTATFIRFMERNHTGDLRRAVDLLGWTSLNEFKRTRVPN